MVSHLYGNFFIWPRPQAPQCATLILKGWVGPRDEAIITVNIVTSTLSDVFQA